MVSTPGSQRGRRFSFRALDEFCRYAKICTLRRLDFRLNATFPQLTELPPHMNCVLYARVSTLEQADLSIPAQLETMRAYAHQKHWLVAEEFVEPGASAKTTERPALQRLLTRIRDSKCKTDV